MRELTFNEENEVCGGVKLSPPAIVVSIVWGAAKSSYEAGKALGTAAAHYMNNRDAKKS